MIVRVLSCAAIVTALTVAACTDDSGKAQKTEGEIKSAVGNVTGDEDLQREGKKDEVVGGVKSAGADLKEAAKDAKD